MAEKITIADVARKASCSLSTVSRAFSEQHINISTKKRIMDIANDLGYSPNRLAQGLASGLSNSYSIIIPDNQNPFYTALAESLQNKLESFGWDSWIVFCQNNPTHLQTQMRRLLDHHVRGIIIFPSNLCDQAPYLYRKIMEEKNPTVPIVLVSERFMTHNRYVVNGDNFTGSKLAIQHLASLGHRRIALVTGSMNNSSLRERYDGYRAALEEYGLQIDESLMLLNAFSRINSNEIKQFCSKLTMSDRPTAVFVCSDFRALPIMRHIRNAGLRIPEDISVMGFDNIWLVEQLGEQLTTVEFPVQEIVSDVVKILTDWTNSNGQIEDRDIRIKPRLIVRGSTSESTL